MSDSKMVSVPRELLERLAAPTFTSGSRRTSLQELRAALAAPAEDGPLIGEGTIPQVSDCAENVRAMDKPSRDDSIAWLMRIDGIGRSRAELICSMGFRRMPEPVSAVKGAE